MPSAKHGLGRGLGALIPTTLLKTPTDGGTREVELARIDPNPRQPRTRIDAAALAEAMSACLSQKPGTQPRESWAPFSLEAVVDQYIQALVGH